MDLSGKAVLITGAARRVGAAIARELRTAGASIAIHYHTSEAAAAALVAELNEPGASSPTRTTCIALQADLADPTSWKSLVDDALRHFGRLDVLVNNASVFPTSGRDTIERFELEEWERIFRLNVAAPAGLAHHARDALADAGGGCIVNLCDTSADRPWPDHLAYCASKAALVNVTKNLARALAPQVRVVGVSPGIAIFPEDYDEELRARLVSKVPLDRPGTPEDMAAVVHALIEQGNYITGQIVAVDGGRGIV
jgi:pteridine reductase